MTFCAAARDLLDLLSSDVAGVSGSALFQVRKVATPRSSWKRLHKNGRRRSVLRVERPDF